MPRNTIPALPSRRVKSVRFRAIASDPVGTAAKVGAEPVSPVDLGDGLLEINLPARGGTSKIECAFTRRTPALDPVEGTLSLALPKTPLCINSLAWGIELPAGYLAETHGNLTHVTAPKDLDRSQLTLQKNKTTPTRANVVVLKQILNIIPRGMINRHSFLPSFAIVDTRKTNRKSVATLVKNSRLGVNWCCPLRDEW
jgi:hypothetical protein